MAKQLSVGQRVKYSPDRGNQNPNGKTIKKGRVDSINEDGTYNLKLDDGSVRMYVELGDKLGMFKTAVEDKKKPVDDVEQD